MPNFIKVKRSGSQNKDIDLEAMHIEKMIVVVRLKKNVEHLFKGAEDRILQNPYT